MKSIIKPGLLFTVILTSIFCELKSQDYKIVDTGVHSFYSNTALISQPVAGAVFYGQDATYQGNEPSYTNNGNGTITDNVTGLMWQQDMGNKISFSAAFTKADSLTLAGYSDWRVPTIKEIYSLILFTGRVNGMTPIGKFIDTVFFNQPLGNTAIGERLIDAQTWSSTVYKSLTMNADTTIFGVNFVDGRIKGYPKYKTGTSVANTMYFRMVRGNPQYGLNSFVDNQDGTITDLATGLMWQQADDGFERDWENALSYAENLELAGFNDWRLPDAKELHSIVDYNRCPDYTNSPAINPLFATTMINDPNGNPGHYPYFWSSSSHLESANPYTRGVYFAFGEALGKMNGIIKDVHGAGAQRSDPKSGNASDYPQYLGPQGDMNVVYNHSRCVRNAAVSINESYLKPEQTVLLQNYPNPFNPATVISYEIEVARHIKLAVFNSKGELVKILTDGMQDAGSHSVNFNAAGLESGIYFYKLESGGLSVVNKMMLLK